MSVYQNTGYQRRKVLTFDKKANGVSMTGYPEQYDITDAFGAQAALNDDEFRRLTTAAYNSRLEAFRTFVETEEDVGDLNETNTPRVENTTACPLP